MNLNNKFTAKALCSAHLSENYTNYLKHNSQTNSVLNLTLNNKFKGISQFAITPVADITNKVLTKDKIITKRFSKSLINNLLKTNGQHQLNIKGTFTSNLTSNSSFVYGKHEVFKNNLTSTIKLQTKNTACNKINNLCLTTTLAVANFKQLTNNKFKAQDRLNFNLSSATKYNNAVHSNTKIASNLKAHNNLVSNNGFNTSHTLTTLNSAQSTHYNLFSGYGYIARNDIEDESYIANTNMWATELSNFALSRYNQIKNSHDTAHLLNIEQQAYLFKGGYAYIFAPFNDLNGVYDGNNFTAYLKTDAIKFSDNELVRLPAVYMNYKGWTNQGRHDPVSNIKLDVTEHESEQEQTHTYKLEDKEHTHALHTARFVLGRNLRGRYFDFALKLPYIAGGQITSFNIAFEPNKRRI